MYRKFPINQHGNPPRLPIRIYLADAVRDAVSVCCSPGAVAACNGRIVAAGDPADVREAAFEAGGGAEPTVHELPGRLLLPGLVNAHTHLDLTGIGARPYIGDFVGWVQQVIRERPEDHPSIAAAVRQGARLSVAAGVLTVGDIAGSAAASEAAEESPVTGVSFRELFGPGPSQQEGAPDTTRSARPAPPPAAGERPSLRPGLQPHAPYSALPELYAFAAAQQLPLSTHLAETPEELAFTRDAAGPFRDLLMAMGKWNDARAALYGHGVHPVDWLAATLDTPPPTGPPTVTPTGTAAPPPPWLCAHCNYVEDEHIRTLASRGWSVAYCPRASDYFGHRDHRYREMLRAGVNVALGTDSIICHGSLSILDEMRYLHQRDGTEPDLLLKMATVNGMRALGLDAADATFEPGAAAGVIAVRYDGPTGADSADALERALSAETPPAVETVHGRREADVCPG